MIVAAELSKQTKQTKQKRNLFATTAAGFI
jgi:hypothetical protein